MIFNQISIALVKEFFQKQLQIYRPLTFKVSFMLWTIEEKKSFMLWTIEEKRFFPEHWNKRKSLLNGAKRYEAKQQP